MPKTSTSIINIICQCGQNITRYKKKKKGRLVRMYIDGILEDKCNLFLNKKFENGESVHCPSCNKKIGHIDMSKANLALKVNQGWIKKIIT